MVTYFNRKDLVSFGEYLLSDRRRQLYLAIDKYEPLMNLEPAEERLKTVSHADMQNWLDIKDGPDGKPVTHSS